MDKAFKTVKEGEQAPPAPDAFVEWAALTSFGLMLGTWIGVAREALDINREQRAKGAPEELAGETAAARRTRLMHAYRDEQYRRLHRMAWAGAKGAAKVGGFVGVFSGVQKYLEYQRHKRDALNYVAAGAAAVTASSLIQGGSPVQKLRTLGSGYAVSKLQDKFDDDDTTSSGVNTQAEAAEEVQDYAGKSIEVLQDSLKKRQQQE
eukprot:jgi/Chlat1/8077/Chrsp75S07583